MKVDFFRANEQKAPTTEFYLFSDDYALMMDGMYIEHAGQHYQVISQRNPEQKDAAHIVFVFPIDRQPVEVNIQLKNEQIL